MLFLLANQNVALVMSDSYLILDQNNFYILTASKNESKEISFVSIWLLKEFISSRTFEYKYHFDIITIYIQDH